MTRTGDRARARRRDRARARDRPHRARHAAGTARDPTDRQSHTRHSGHLGDGHFRSRSPCPMSVHWHRNRNFTACETLARETPSRKPHVTRCSLGVANTPRLVPRVVASRKNVALMVCPVACRQRSSSSIAAVKPLLPLSRQHVLQHDLCVS